MHSGLRLLVGTMFFAVSLFCFFWARSEKKRNNIDRMGSNIYKKMTPNLYLVVIYGDIVAGILCLIFGFWALFFL